MADKFTAQQFLDQTFERLQTVAKDGGQKWMGDVKAFVDSQKSTLDSFQREVDKRFNSIATPVNEINRTAAELNKIFQLDSTKAFMRDPIKGGETLVVKGLKSLDKWFAQYVIKPLGTDITKLFKDVAKNVSKAVWDNGSKAIGAIFKTIWNATINPALKLTKTAVDNIKKVVDKVPKAASTEITNNAVNLFKKITGPLSDWSKNIGLTGVAKNFPKMLEMAKTSSASANALKDLPKLLPMFANVGKIVVKVLPILGALVDIKWREDVKNNFKDVERKVRLNGEQDFRNHMATFKKLKELETLLKSASIDYTKISSAVKTSIPSDLARKSDVTTIGTAIGKINYTQQLTTIAQGVSALKNLGQTQTIDYSRIQNGVTTALTANQTPTKEPTAIDYLKVTAAAAAAITAANLSPSSISDSVVSKTKEPTAIDYQKVTTAAAAALTAANLSPSSISDSVTAKTKSVTPAELAQILERNNTTQSLAQAAAIKQGLAGVKVDIPADVARKSDVEAIPSKIPKATLDLAPVLSRLSTIDNTLVNLGQRFKPVDINPVQDKLNQIQNQVSQIPSQVTNTLNTVSNSIVSSLSNFITNNNTTIVNKMEPALNADAIINPIKTHINTQVAQPLATTMEVLNVNDLKRGVTMSGEAVIKASGFQQYGQSGTATATNLIGLTAMIAAPLFMRAGFHQLGTTFPADMRNPTGAKVTPTTALGTSQWQFDQVSNLVGIPAKQMVTSSTGVVSAMSFKNQSDAIENIHAQNLGMEQDLSAIEKYLFKILQGQEMQTQMILQNKYDIEVLMQESGAKTGQKIILRPGAVSHGTGQSFFDKLMDLAQSAMVVREWKGDIDAKQLALKTNMEAQIAALTNKFEFDKNDPKIPMLDRPKQNPKAKNDEDWKRYVNTVENPGTLRQSVGLPIPEIKEIKLGSTREIPKPTTDPDKLLGS